MKGRTEIEVFAEELIQRHAEIVFNKGVAVKNAILTVEYLITASSDGYPYDMEIEIPFLSEVLDYLKQHPFNKDYGKLTKEELNQYLIDIFRNKTNNNAR